MLLASENIVGLVWWLAIAIILLGVFWMVWRSLRKWYLSTAEESSAAAPWTLQELRELRDRGEITIEEHDQLRQQIIGGFKDTH